MCKIEYTLYRRAVTFKCVGVCCTRQSLAGRVYLCLGMASTPAAAMANACSQSSYRNATRAQIP